MINNENWVVDFSHHLRLETGLAKGSCDKIIYVAKEWVAWLSAQGRACADISRETVMEFFSTQEKYSKSTVGRKLWMLKKMYNWAKDQRLISTNPFASIPGPRTGSRFIAYVPSVRAVELLMEQPDTMLCMGIRDRACLELLYGAGIRARELLNIRLKDLHLKDRYVIIKGKGGYERLAVFGESAQCWLGQYLDIRSSIPTGKVPAGNMLFIHRRSAMNYDMLRTMVKFYAKKAGFGLISPHSLRHAFATHMYQQGANIRVIQMLLGHAHLETTTIYVHALTHELRDLWEHHHPRGDMYKPKKRPLTWRKGVNESHAASNN